MSCVTRRRRHGCVLGVAGLRQQLAAGWPESRGAERAAFVPVGGPRRCRATGPPVADRARAPAPPARLSVDRRGRAAPRRERRRRRRLRRTSDVQRLLHRHQAATSPHHFRSRARRLHVDKWVRSRSESRSGSGGSPRRDHWTEISTDVQKFVVHMFIECTNKLV